MQLTSFNRRSLQSLGAHIIKHRPDIANEFIPLITQDEEKDLSLIPRYFDDFCHFTATNKETFLWEKNNYTNVELKRQFVGVILMFFHPSAIECPNACFKAQYGLMNTIANTLQMDCSNTSKMVKLVMVRLRAYADFKEVVSSIHSQINEMYARA